MINQLIRNENENFKNLIKTQNQNVAVNFFFNFMLPNLYKTIIGYSLTFQVSPQLFLK